MGTTWAPPVETRQLCSCWGSMSVYVYVCVCVCVCVFVYAKYKAARSNLEPAVCNGERQREYLDVFISEAISLLIKVKHLFTIIRFNVCVFMCV